MCKREAKYSIGDSVVIGGVDLLVVTDFENCEGCYFYNEGYSTCSLVPRNPEGAIGCSIDNFIFVEEPDG